jgi:hypothetical protein
MSCRLVIDFDGTLVYSEYPKIGKLKPNVVEVMNKLYNEGYSIIINTCRAGIYEGQCYQFLKKHKIPYHYINSNLPCDIEHFKQDCRKISGDIYIDDKQLGGIPEDWNEIYNMIKEHERKLL